MRLWCTGYFDLHFDDKTPTGAPIKVASRPPMPGTQYLKGLLKRASEPRRAIA